MYQHILSNSFWFVLTNIHLNRIFLSQKIELWFVLLFHYFQHFSPHFGSYKILPVSENFFAFALFYLFLNIFTKLFSSKINITFKDHKAMIHFTWIFLSAKFRLTLTAIRSYLHLTFTLIQNDFPNSFGFVLTNFHLNRIHLSQSIELWLTLMKHYFQLTRALLLQK